MEDTVTCNAYISYVHRNGMGNNGWNFDSVEIKFQRAKAYKSKSSRNKKKHLLPEPFAPQSENSQE